MTALGIGAVKILEFNKPVEITQHSAIEPERKQAITDIDKSKELEEAIAILGLDQPVFSFSEDYGWMVETTKEILRSHGIAYFRNNVLRLIKAWQAYKGN